MSRYPRRGVGSAEKCASTGLLEYARCNDMVFQFTYVAFPFHSQNVDLLLLFSIGTFNADGEM